MMTMNKASPEESRAEPDLRIGIARRVVQVLGVTIFQASILFLSSGHLGWVWAWVFIGLYLTGMLVNAVLMLRLSPQTVAARAEAGGMKDWDKVVGGLFGVTYFLVVPLVAGLDFRFGWTSGDGLALRLAGAVAFSLGFALLIWAMVSNAHFATVVRIEEDRGHAVCTSGPYQFVRHPGYVGAMLHSLTIPFILGALWALIPGGIAALLLVIRTALEDRTLQDELDGYREYAMQVRHRLVPGVW